MTVKEDKTRLNIAKHRYKLMMSNWGELNRKYRTLLHVNGLGLSAFVVYLGFVMDEINSFVNISSLECIVPIMFFMLLFSLAFMVGSLIVLLDFRNLKTNLNVMIEFPKKYASSLTKEYEKTCDDIVDKCDKLNKNISLSTCFLIPSFIALFLSIGIVFMAKRKMQSPIDPIDDMICKLFTYCLFTPPLI